MRRWILIGSCWLAWGLFSASRLRVDIPGIDWSTALRYAVPDAVFWAILTPVPLFLARRFPITAGQVVSHGGLHLVAAVAVSLSHTLLDTLFNVLRDVLGGGDVTVAGMFSHLLYYAFHLNILLYAAIAGIAHYMMRAESLRQRERLATELRAQLSEARLEALRMQLRPHFLFNVLNTISGLMEQDPHTGQRVIRQLGDLLRMSLSTRGSREIPLAEELEFARAYLEIEQVRFADRLVTHIDASPSALACVVPPFILQPIVENAVRHGIAPLAAGGRIDVSATCRNGALELKVTDNGAGTDLCELSPGIGIANTRARLQELYGSKHDFRMEPEPDGGLSVTLSLPRLVVGDKDSGTPGLDG